MADFPPPQKAREGTDHEMANVEITLLGRFETRVDGTPVDPGQWTRRHAAGLVKLLALTPGRRLHREQVIDALWPDEMPADAAPKLHKAAHFARRSLGRQDAIVLRDDVVALFPDADVAVDVLAFEELARAALASRESAAVSEALASYGGPLLPDEPYAEWLVERRERLELRHRDLLRAAGRWETLVELDPADEEAHVELMRRFAAAGDRHGALRQYERMDRALRNELGVGPGPDAVRLRDELLAGLAGPAPADTTEGAESAAVLGRERELASIGAALNAAASGSVRVVVLSGPPGIGKTALLDAAGEAATARGFKTGHASAAAIAGAWPYAPVLEALADLCRRHVALLDGLADVYREEIDRALTATGSWTGESSHQRLFVATAELLRLAGATSGVLLSIDDAHEADDASLRLLHYLIRAVHHDRVVVLLAHRPAPATGPLADFRHALVGRHGAVELELGPIDLATTRQLIARHVADPPEELIDRIDALAGGNPFAVEELARRAAGGAASGGLDPTVIGGVPPSVRTALQRVAVVGTTFDTDEFVALSALSEADAFACLDEALAARIIEPSPAGYRFRHHVVRDALVEDLPPHRRRQVHQDAARRLIELGAAPARVGHHFLEAGRADLAVEPLLQAAESAGAVGAYKDALELLAPVRDRATGRQRARLCALRADLLLAVGDPGTMAAYREALEYAAPGEQPMLRARLARAALMSGDLDTAEAALAGVETDGGPADGEILLARGMLAYFRSDLDTAWAIAEESRSRVLAGDRRWQVLDLAALQGLLAHHRGEWSHRIHTELRATSANPELANAVFDGYLCPAEYMLYGQTPYADVIATARELRATARRSGALRAVAFATALIGEAALLSGDLELAARELEEAAELHRDLNSGAGEAHSLQRLAEVRLAQGDREAAFDLLHRAAPIARWSALAMHLLQRIYGTMIAAAPDAGAARAVVDESEAVIGVEDHCAFCSVMLAVPAAIACARAGDVDDARRYVKMAERSGRLWEGTSWAGATLEARAHLALAEGDQARADQLLAEAATHFRRAGQPLDVERCRRPLPTADDGPEPALAQASGSR